MKAHICAPFNSQVNGRIYGLKDNKCVKLLKSNNIAALYNVKRNVNIQTRLVKGYKLTVHLKSVRGTQIVSSMNIV
jgi:hypothetical protein